MGLPPSCVGPFLDQGSIRQITKYTIQKASEQAKFIVFFFFYKDGRAEGSHRFVACYWYDVECVDLRFLVGGDCDASGSGE